MKRLHSNQICTMTELREPQKIFDRAGGKPVAILKNSKCIGYLVPEEAALQGEPRYATAEEVLRSLEQRRAVNQPVLDYLKDK